MLLEAAGYRVLTATDGKEAVQVFLSNSVDLVVLDYHMPEMNGAVAAVRMKNAKPDIPIAILSADDCLPPSDLQAVDCFISKSEPIVTFLEKVDYLLSLRLLFQPLEELIARNAGNRRDTTDAKRFSARSNGISMKNDGIQKAS
jgi:CheY-like chemotaxis protein